MVSLYKPRPTKAERKAQKSGSKGGRPRADGARYPSGKLRPAGPNPEVLARRALICADPTMATTPLDAAYANGWLTQAQYGAGKAYIAARAAAQQTFQFSAAPNRRITATDNSIQTGAADEMRQDWSGMTTNQVLAVRWNELTSKEIAVVWDSAMRDVGRYVEPSKANEFAGRALDRWKALAAAMTSFERMAVDAFCLFEEWPLWLSDKIGKREVARGMDRRELLVSGLKALQHALRPPATPARQDLAAPVVDQGPQGPVVIERTVYTDADGQVMYEAERRVRRVQQGN